VTITAEDLRAIRDRIGYAEPPTDDDIDALWVELESVDRVVLSIMETRFAATLAKPAKYAIEGDSSFDYSENLKAQERALNAQRAKTQGGLATGQLLANWDR
jgi:hypothetical protein